MGCLDGCFGLEYGRVRGEIRFSVVVRVKTRCDRLWIVNCEL